jgi:hypothetical protein
MEKKLNLTKTSNIMAKSEHYTKLNGFKIDGKSVGRLITPANYAKIEGVTPKCIYDRIKRGELQHVVISGVFFIVRPTGA